MTRQEIEAEVARRHWFHRITLPFGVVTPGPRGTEHWTDYQLPARLTGLSVLDVGAWDGAWSFEAERRGAKTVTALDVWDRDTPGSLGGGLSNFEFVRAVLDSKVKAVQGDVYTLDHSTGTFDLVLFLQVLYHLQDPLRALHNLRSIAASDGLVVLETWLDAEWLSEPAAIFYPGLELGNDPTNWWGPNAACVHSMARAAGFDSKLVWSEVDTTHFKGRGKRACFHLRPQSTPLPVP